MTTFAPAIENRAARIAVHGDDVAINLYILLDLNPRCGIDAQMPLQVSMIDHDFTVTLDDLNDLGWGAFIEADGILWEIYVSRDDQGIANRLD